MAALEQVMQLRQQGMSERQIIDSLKSQGVSPKDINDALSQSQIKSELSPEQNPQSIPQPNDNYAQSNPYEDLGIPPPQMQNSSQQYQEPQMQQSIMSQNNPQRQTMPPQYQPQMQQQETFQQYPITDFQSAEPQQYQEQYPEYEYQQQIDVETITEIAEQIAEEKTEELKKQVLILTKQKEESTLKIERVNKRLEKIENSFNELQMAILGKISDYSQDLQDISQDLHATQESFSKVLNPIINKQRETHQETTTHKHKGKSRKQSEDFEKFLR